MNTTGQAAGNMSASTSSSRIGSRDTQLDLLRGVAVAGMFFFSFVATISDSLPAVLTHNVPGKLLVGDFVLSLFLFCSGVSLALVCSRYTTVWTQKVWRKLIVRILQMVAVSVFITPFSTSSVLGMDEMMLNAALTLPAFLVIACGRAWVVLCAVGIWVLRDLLVGIGVVPALPTVYLGGYPLAVFWLPIMLGGALVWSRTEREIARQLLMWTALLVVAVVLSGLPDKMALTPSFGVLSVCVALVTLLVFRRHGVRCHWLEYFGSKPLRMWCLMFALLGPVRLYAEVVHERRVLSLSPLTAIVASLAWMGCCYLLSRAWDAVALRRRVSTGR
jgi:hypothetical protein